VSVRLSVVFAVAVCACAQSVDAGPAPPVDGAAVPPNVDGPADAGALVEGGDEGLPPPRTCSNDGLCHTALPNAEKLEGVWGDGTGIAWAVSTGGSVLRWDGLAWTVHAVGLGPLHAIWGSGPLDVWIAGDEGVRHGTGAASASLVFGPPSALPEGAAPPITSLWGLSASDVWAVSAGHVLCWKGTAWATVDVASGVSFRRVWGSAAAGVFVAALRPVEGESFEEAVVLRRGPGAPTFTTIALPTDPNDTSVFSKIGSIKGAVVTSPTSVWLFGRSVSSVPGIWRGTSTDEGKTFTFTYARDGRHDDPEMTAAAGVSASEAWAVGDYGRVRRWDGREWSPVAVTPGKLPVTEALRAVWTAGASETWFVGDGLALRHDPSKKGAAQ